jgi:hypothetical protein
MKRYILSFIVLIAMTASIQAEDFWHDSVRACIVGGGVIGATSALVLYPAVMASPTTLPATVIVMGNTIFGCGLGAIGTMLAYGAGSAYDSLFAHDADKAIENKVPEAK